MSLRTLYLDELNSMAKKRDPGFAAKLREVMVDRHPATLDPDEYDPVATVALAWKEVAPRGRAAFESFAEEMIDRMERARVQADPGGCDWPLAHAVCRLLRMVPAAMIDLGLRGRFVRKLSGMVADRQDFLALTTGSHTEPNTLWTDAFQLYLAWHPAEPTWLDTLWLAALNDTTWPMDEGACLFLEDAAVNHPDFVTIDRLVVFWKAAHRRRTGIGELRRWFYLVGAALEDSPEGIARLNEVFDNLGGHLQDHRLEARHLPWDMFVEAVAAMFRNPAKHQAALAFKSPPRVPDTARSSHQRIPPAYMAEKSTILEQLTRFLQNGTAEPQLA